jgi:beta-lactamase regulating signal transducer with metallopeptidase domain
LEERINKKGINFKIILYVILIFWIIVSIIVSITLIVKKNLKFFRKK